MKKLMAAVVILLFAGVLWLGYFVSDIFFQDRGAGEESHLFTIQAGEGVNTISRHLAQDGLIKSKFNFETYVWLLRRENRIQAGEYQLQPSMSLRQLVNMITYGWGINEKRLTIVEGWTNQQIAEYLADNLFTYLGTRGSRENYIAAFHAAARESFDYDALASKPQSVDLEGYLFPDTYNFYTQATSSEVVDILLRTFDSKLTLELRQQIKQQGRTIHEAVTLASILEREVRTEQDKRLVADIFWRRLDIGMALQADSTVNYLTGKKTPSVSAADKQIDSPYNTYKYPGLPPGPIDNPGLTSIRAAADPLPNDYWYFLTAPEGEVVYSKALREHNAAKEKYLK
ncbi:endolytic transglycosylase MltG [Candidatus Falkowbacteria bacterium]|nr:endolytic transglycosylase MltG [Candidatus Falkowbacteria bacterium]